MYHRIAAEAFDPWGLAVSPQRFQAQLAWLQRHRSVIQLRIFAELHRAGRLPARAIAITFDDGYACNAEVAAPLLETHGLAATIFLPTELIAAGQEYWWDDLERIVLGCPAEQIEVQLPSGRHMVQIGARQPADRTWRPGDAPSTPRQEGFQAIWRMLREVDPVALRRAMEVLRSQAPDAAHPRKSHRAMTVDEIRRIQSDRIEMGGHSLTHTALSHRDAATQAAEIGGSRSQCAAITGAMPACFAYPYGDHDATSVRLAAEAGFTCACTTEAAAVSRTSHPFALPRIQVGDWDETALARALRVA